MKALDEDKKKKNSKDKKAAALKFEPGIAAAPRVVAAGKGQIAENIINKAIENKVPVHKDENLAEKLSKMPLGHEIPEEMYDIVAQILFFVAEMDEKYEQYKI